MIPSKEYLLFQYLTNIGTSNIPSLPPMFPAPITPASVNTPINITFSAPSSQSQVFGTSLMDQLIAQQIGIYIYYIILYYIILYYIILYYIILYYIILYYII
jgi:hypothetical protein